MEENEVTQLLLDWSHGDDEAFEELVPLVIGELRQRAEAYLRRERSDHTLQPTALVNEVYLQLVDQNRIEWRNRTHFFAVAARMMRHLLVDHARARAAEKRGGNVEIVPLEEARAGSESRAVDLLALDEALEGLTRLNPRQARVVEMRYFAGLTLEETAEVLGINRVTVGRDWRNARMWLRRQLSHRRT
jgi:RNA polymerase sigma factor (TIGR02999 family)